jgi:hypothetical protein
MKKEESAKKVMQKKESDADGRCPCYISHSDNQNSKLHSSQKASGSPTQRNAGRCEENI